MYRDVSSLRPYVQEIVEHIPQLRTETIAWLDTVTRNVEENERKSIVDRFIEADTAIDDDRARVVGRRILHSAAARKHIHDKAMPNDPSSQSSRGVF